MVPKVTVPLDFGIENLHCEFHGNVVLKESKLSDPVLPQFSVCSPVPGTTPDRVRGG